MKILFVNPPHVPFYFNLCYNYTALGEVAGYIKNKGYSVTIFDGGVLNASWNELGKKMLEKFEVIAIYSTFGNVEASLKLIRYARRLCPKSKLIIYGQPATYIPKFFRKYNVDAIVETGDAELGIEKYASFIKKKLNFDELSGISININGEWKGTKKGEWLSPDELAWPALELLPIDSYFKLYEHGETSVAGLAGKKELAASVSRGCSGNCAFCPVVHGQGQVDRRHSVKNTVDFIESAMAKYSFDYFSAYSAIFTFNKSWVYDFCNELDKRNLKLKWKCVSGINFVDKPLLKRMSESGCFRIGFGIETLDPEVQKNIEKRIDVDRIEKVLADCKDVGITPLCFLMIGMPEQTKESIEYTLTKIKEWGGVPRITAYSPFQTLTEDITIEELDFFDRKTIGFNKIKGIEREEYFNLTFQQS